MSDFGEIFQKAKESPGYWEEYAKITQGELDIANAEIERLLEGVSGKARDTETLLNNQMRIETSEAAARVQCYEDLRKANAEVDRLTKEVKAYAKIIKGFDSWKSLLTQSADALDAMVPDIMRCPEYMGPIPNKKLIQDLREETK